MSTGIGLGDRAPIISLRLDGGGHVDVHPRATWHFEDLIDEVLPLLSRTPPGGSERKIQLSGRFATSAPGLELAPEKVATLAVAGVGLGIELSATGFDSARRTRLAHGTDPVSTEARVSFVVRGHFDPDRFSERVSLRPTSVVREDAPRPLKARMSVWRLGTAPVTAAAFSQATTDRLLALLTPRRDQISQAVADSGLRSALRYFVMFRDLVPKLMIPSDQLAKIAGLNSWLEYSVSVLRERDGTVEF